MRQPQEFEDWMARRGGVASAAHARAEGFTTHGIRVAVASGHVARLRRTWLVTPGCDPELREAAALGGRLTCLSAARRLRLWTPDHDRLHVAVPSTSARLAADEHRLHWSSGPAPVAATALEDPIINVLFHVARCVPLADALAVWESAVRTRQVDAAVLARVRWRSTAARRLAETASALSDSGVETRFVILMHSIGVSVRQQVRIDGHRVDGLIGDSLVVQIDGFQHHRAADRRRDITADARLTLRGYTVLRFDYMQVLFQPDQVIAVVSAAIAQRLHDR